MNKRDHKHILSIDLESWIFSKKINSQNLSVAELKRLEKGYTPSAVKLLLKSLKKNNQKITFFVVTKLEEVYPGIIESILTEGHEVGWHTHRHPVLGSISELEKELESAKKIISKYKMQGFQAPNIIFQKKWYKLLSDYGFSYSSSIYGNSNKVYRFDNISEIPVSLHTKNHPAKKLDFAQRLSVQSVIRNGIPIGSSFFWGILGNTYYDRKLKTSEKKSEVMNMFIHDWQILTPQSEDYKKDVGFLWNPLFLPYRINVRRMFEELISNHQFMRMDEYLKDFKKNEKKRT